MSEPLPDVGFFPSVYVELRQLAAAKRAHESAGHGLYAMALVHEPQRGSWLTTAQAARSDRELGRGRSAICARRK